MKIGVLFPQTEIGADMDVVTRYAQSVEDFGFDYLQAEDHVLGVDPNYYKGWTGHRTYKHTFHEPLVLFAYLSGVVKKLEFGSRIIIMPQRQTPLLAKQAAQLDLVSGGRLRLGFGVGWNSVEFQAMGYDYHTRGRRCDEQIKLLRELWTQELVTFEGEWDRIVSAGINPLPVQRPIPIWLGGDVEPVIRRVGRLADGWMPGSPPGESSHELLDRIKSGEQLKRIRQYAYEAGRNPETIGLEGRIGALDTREEEWAEMINSWRQIGATHLTFHTVRGPFDSVEEHVNAVQRFYNAAVAQ